MATVDIIELIKPETGEKFYPYAHLNGVKGAELLPRIGSPIQTTLSTAIYQLHDALGAQFYPQTHAEAVVGLAQAIADSQFFEERVDPQDSTKKYIWLKDIYTGIGALGWIAAGGVGQGGGGGGGSYVSWGTEQGSVVPLTVEGTTKRLLMDGALAGYALSSSIPTALSQLSADSTHRLVTDSQISNWNSKTSFSGNYNDLTNKPTIPTDDTVEAWGFTKNQGTVKSVTLTQGTGITVSNSGEAITETGGRTISISQTYRSYISHGETAYGWGNHASAGYLTQSSLSGYATQDWVQGRGYLTSESDPTVPPWAKASNKPSYAFSELTSHPTTLAGYGITDGFKKTGGDISGDIYHEIEEEDVETGEISIYNLWRITENGEASFDSLSVNGVDFSTINTRVNTLWNARNNYLPLSGGTMTGNIVMNGGSILSATDSANQVGSVTNRFGNGFFRNIYTTYFGFRDGSDGSIQRGTIGMGDGYTNIYMQASDGTPYGQYVFNATYGFFHDGNGNVPCGRSDHRWSELWAVDAGLSGDLVLSTNAKGIYGTDTSGNARRLITLANDNGIYFGNGNASRLNFSANGLIQFSWGASGSGRYVSFGDVAGSAQSGACCYMPSMYPNLSSMDIGMASSRWRKIYAHDMDMSGELSLASSSHIDIGPLRIEYDATNKALHITKKDGNDTNTYGLYADGFVAAGGVQINA